jgi:hypothetical protein
VATYAENAHRREIAARRRVQDARDAARHRAFDLAAQDNHFKYERAHFAVVTASDAFRAGYEQIDWR